ncbi:hypothetical protein AB9P05_22725 [Roseivirga sp. BDSF3-8]|uniref:hypothetical protein n=1 Tax=Roseivirga sp. BDSF3-8 TaxID=3241598 RepID=UPI003532488E
MSENFYHSDKIDAYFNQAMSEGERQLFEQQVAQDPLLRNEFDLQQDIIESLKETRRVELKSRLQNIPTPGTGLISVPAQFIGGAMLVGVLALVGYFMWEDPFAEQQDQIDLTANNLFIIEQQDIPARPQVVLIPEDKAEDESIPEYKAGLIKDEVTASLNLTDKASSRTEEVSEPTASIDLPNLMEDSEGDGDAIDNTQIELPESGLDPLEENLTDNVEIEHISTKSEKRQYQFYNGKLYLYGSFGSVPYEILEINGKKGKSYYLYHNELYYRLNSNQMDIKPLLEITNKKIVRELDIVRTNK